MTCINIHESKSREKLSNRRQCFIRDVVAFCPPNKKNGLIEPSFLRILIGEVSEVGKRFTQDIQRYTEFLNVLSRWPM